MSRFTRSIRVVANPYAAPLDAKGRPCGVVPRVPNALGQPNGFIGAKISKTIPLRGLALEIGDDLRSVPQETLYEFSSDPVEINVDMGSVEGRENAPYYRSCLQCGDLLAGDESTARWAGLDKFEDPSKALAAAKAACEKLFEDHYGAGSLAEVRGEQPAPVKRAKGDS